VVPGTDFAPRSISSCFSLMTAFPPYGTESLDLDAPRLGLFAPVCRDAEFVCRPDRVAPRTLRPAEKRAWRCHTRSSIKCPEHLRPVSVLVGDEFTCC
jgi:hypothetical protein